MPNSLIPYNRGILGATAAGMVLSRQGLQDTLATLDNVRDATGRLVRWGRSSGQNLRVNTVTPDDSPPRSQRKRLRNGEPPEDDPPSPAQANMPAATNPSNGDEVPVMPIPRNVSKVIPNYFTINCPFEFSIGLSANTFTHGPSQTTPACRIRLNSVYDPVAGLIAGLTGNIMDKQPQGRDLWAGMFKYYRVISSDVTIQLMSRCVYDPFIQNAKYDPFHHHFVWGYELVDQDQTLCNSLPAFLVAKTVKRTILGPAPFTLDSTNAKVPTGMSSSTLSYHYNPSDWNYHVREVGAEERWTPIKQNPSVDHDLAVRIFHMDSTNSPQAFNFNMGLRVQVNYLVQFMEENEANYKVRDTTLATYGGPGEDLVDD